MKAFANKIISDRMEKDIEELLTRYSEGKLSAEEAEELYRRVTTSDTDAEAFRNWRETETLGRALRQLSDSCHLCGIVYAEQPDARPDDPN